MLFVGEDAEVEISRLEIRFLNQFSSLLAMCERHIALGRMQQGVLVANVLGLGRWRIADAWPVAGGGVGVTPRTAITSVCSGGPY